MLTKCYDSLNCPFHDVPPFLQPNVPPAERRVALVVGNGRYAAERDVLTNPPNDATAMATKLSRIGFFGVKRDGEVFAVDFSAPGWCASIARRAPLS